MMEKSCVLKSLMTFWATVTYEILVIFNQQKGSNSSNTLQVLSFQNNLKNLEPSFKMDLDVLDCFKRK